MVDPTRSRWTLVWVAAAIAACGDGSTDPGPGPDPARTPVATVGALAGDVSEGLDAIVSVRLDPPPASPISVRYTLSADGDPATADADTADYRADGSVSVPAGTSVADVRIAIRDDDDIEPAREAFLFSLDAPATGAGYRLGATTSTQVTIAEGVCDRTPEIRDALVVRSRADSCSGVTTAHLGITTLNLAGIEIPTLRPGDLSGLYNLRNLDLSGVGFTAFPVGVFADLTSLETLRLRSNGFETLPTDAFAGLARLKTLDLGDNALTTLSAESFAGLTSLETLEVRSNAFATLPAGAFAELTGLERLHLGANDFTTLGDGVFAGLAKLEWLYLGNGRIGALEAGVFSGLTGLESLLLQDTGLEALPAGVFKGLSSLRELRLDRNALEALPEDAFADLSRLESLRLYGNRLAELPAGLLSGLSALRVLRLDGNRLAALPEQVFVGLSGLDTLLLAENPGAPFALALELERTDNPDPAATGPARIALAVGEGAPFAMTVPLSARGGALSAEMAVLEAGSERSAEITVTATEGGQSEVQVVAGPVPAVPRRVTGIEVGLGDPLILFGEGTNAPPVPEREVAPQRLQSGAHPTTFTASDYFRDPEGAAVRISGVSADVAVATVTAEDGVVTLTPVAAGSTTVTLTATDPPGATAELSFPVIVREAASRPFDIDLILLDEVTDSQAEAFADAVDFWTAILADTELADVPLGQDVAPGCWDITTDQRIGTVDDIAFVASVREIDGEDGVLARAGPCVVRDESRLPAVGALELDAADLARLEEEGNLKDVEEVILHEIGHVLGIGTVWVDHGLLRNLSVHNTGADTHFTGPLAIAAFDERGGANYDDGEKVPVENTSGPGAADSHWRESVLGHELMTPFQAPGERDLLSLITVQSLADLGYEVKVGLAEIYRIPGSTGGARATPERRIPYGDDILRGPIRVVDRNGRVVRIIPN
ncbi:leucine-rich repeat protein [Candidatus Palauibacter soopunensis]|uniref:leucine-rich repeat protein n=1 Tax=Candidatus Palauibacter soopunensis TaxID=3056739 RepID=UPI00239C12B8|nr:leucine-rich repeat protein [Candidatus Palauibacter soopunensis]MDE2878658.1 leucine-rich repeat protein [Candidatus Palauibacter soopunensis]